MMQSPVTSKVPGSNALAFFTLFIFIGTTGQLMFLSMYLDSIPSSWEGDATYIFAIIMGSWIFLVNLSNILIALTKLGYRSQGIKKAFLVLLLVNIVFILRIYLGDYHEPPPINPAASAIRILNPLVTMGSFMILAMQIIRGNVTENNPYRIS